MSALMREPATTEELENLVGSDLSRSGDDRQATASDILARFPSHLELPAHNQLHVGDVPKMTVCQYAAWAKLANEKAQEEEDSEAPASVPKSSLQLVIGHHFVAKVIGTDDKQQLPVAVLAARAQFVRDADAVHRFPTIDHCQAFCNALGDVMDMTTFFGIPNIEWKWRSPKRRLSQYRAALTATAQLSQQVRLLQARLARAERELAVRRRAEVEVANRKAVVTGAAGRVMRTPADPL